MKEQIEELLKDTDIRLHDITNINHKPHPYMITPNHINIAQDYGGILGEDVLNHSKSKCGINGCNLSYKEHISDKVVVLQWKKGTEEEEINRVLNLIVTEVGEDKLDGFIFIEPK